MSYYIVILSLHAVVFIAADWIKLPSISPTTPATAFISSHPHEIPKVVFKLAPAPDPNILSSETMSSVFSYRSTTEPTRFPPTTKKSYLRKYFLSTVTSKVINFAGNVSDLVDHNEFMEPIILQHSHANRKKNNVRFYNKTVAMNVIPLKANPLILQDEEAENEGEEENGYDEDDDGVTITVDENNSEERNPGDEEYYYDDDDDDDLNKLPQKYHYKRASTSTSTTEMPKTHKKSRDKNSNAQKRMMIQMLRKSPKKPFSNINFPNFIRFIKKIQESFALSTAKTIGDKIKMLMSFRDRLMVAINRQIKKLWVKQPREENVKKRTKRTLGGGGGWMEHGTSNAMDFPSAEGALLSICFLTFAVFLIKLVLQVIQTIKMKKAMWASQMMMGGTDTVVIKRRSERDIRYDEEYYNLAKTLDSIHNLKIR